MTCFFQNNWTPGVGSHWNAVGSTCQLKEKQPQFPGIQLLLDEMLYSRTLLAYQEMRVKEVSTKRSVVEEAFKARPRWVLWLLYCLLKQENTREHRLHSENTFNIGKCWQRMGPNYFVGGDGASHAHLLGVTKFWFQVSHWANFKYKVFTLQPSTIMQVLDMKRMMLKSLVPKTSKGIRKRNRRVLFPASAIHSGKIPTCLEMLVIIL